ncbi:MAG: calcium-binding protein [Pseudanabaenaceae cyanobacterium]
MAILTIVGTGAGDLLSSTNGGPTELFGDVLPGTPNAEATPFGDDTLVGGPGNDTLFGQRGNDSLVGGGNDDLRGGSGRDTLVGTGNDTLFGNKDADMLFGGAQAFGGQGNDTIFGSSTGRGELGNDIVYGGVSLFGGQGNDTLVAGSTTVSMTGNEGPEDEFNNDQFIFAPATTLTIAGRTIVQGGFNNTAATVIQDFQSGPGLGDVIKLVNLDSGARVVVSQNGADVRIVVTGTASPDTGAPEPQSPTSPTSRTQTVNQTITVRNTNIQQFLAVGSEDLLLESVSVGGQVALNTANMTTDSVNTSTVFSFVIGDRNGRRIDASNRNIGITLTRNFSNLQDPNGVFVFSSVNNDTIVGTTGDDSIDGLESSDIIEGRSGNDTLRGGFGNDTLVGGAAEFAPQSRDFLFGDEGNDLIYGDSLPGGVAPSANKSLRDFIDGGDGNDTLFGQGEDDTILGSAGFDFINGGDGNDSLLGNADDDTVFGETGRDTILGGDGNDVLDGGTDPDSVSGEAGNDSINGASGNDVLFGNAGRDTIFGGLGNDSIDGGDDNDTLFGESSEDTLRGGAGGDSLNGGEGNDLLDGGDGNDFIDGESPNGVSVIAALPPSLRGVAADYLQTTFPARGNLIDSTDPIPAQSQFFPNGILGDVVSYKFSPAAVNVNLVTGVATGWGTDTLKDIEHIVGSNFRDTLTGDGNANGIFGEDGDDSISGGGGDDFLSGDEGNDSIDGGAGNDTIFGGVSGQPGNDSLFGGDGNDTITGGSGNDTLNGGSGNDTLNGGSGDDVYILDNPGDVVDVVQEPVGAGSFDTVVLTGGGVYTLTQHFTNIERIEVATSVPVTLPAELAPITVVNPATPSVNITFAGSAAVLFNGTPGNDSLTGGNGNDQLNGGGGSDTLTGGIGADTLTGSSGGDIFVYSTLAANNAGVNNVDTITDFNPNDGDRIQVPSVSVFLDPDLDGDGIPSTVSTLPGIANNYGDVYTLINTALPVVANRHFFVEVSFGSVNSVFVAIADGTPGFTTGGTSQDTLIRLGSGVIAPAGSGNFII